MTNLYNGYTWDHTKYCKDCGKETGSLLYVVCPACNDQRKQKWVCKHETVTEYDIHRIIDGELVVDNRISCFDCGADLSHKPIIASIEAEFPL